MEQKTHGQLSQRVVSGTVWMLSQTVLSQVVNLSVQLILARLLLKEDFGIYGLAMTVYSLSQTLHQSGIQDVLVQRPHKFNLWAPYGLLLSLIAGVLALVLTIVMAPFAASLYSVEDSSTFIGLICLMALNFPISAAGCVARAKLHIDMRFRAIAGVAATRFTLDGMFKLLFVWMGFGVLSFGLATVLAAGLTLVLIFLLEPPIWPAFTQLSRMKYLIGNGLQLMVSSILSWVSDEADCILLGLMTSPAIVGPYFVGTRIARQAVALLSQQGARAIYPAIAHLGQCSARQTSAFIRSCRLIVILLTPVCLIMAISSECIVQLAFEPEWFEMHHVVTAMALTGIFRLSLWPTIMFLQAQGKYAIRTVYSSVLVCVLLPALFIASMTGNSAVVAWTCGTLCSLLSLAMLFRSFEDKALACCWKIYFPVISGLIAAMLFVAIADQCWGELHGPLKVGIRSIIALIGYVIGVHTVDKQIFTEVVFHLVGLFQRFRNVPRFIRVSQQNQEGCP